MPQADPYAGLDNSFSLQLHQLASAVAAQGGSLQLVSGHRDNAEQTQLYNNAVAKYGQANAANWAAPPGHSNHELGLAMDIHGDAHSMALAHQLAPKFGLNFPLANESWHIEPIGIRKSHDNQGGPVASGPPVATDPNAPVAEANTASARVSSVIKALTGDNGMLDPKATGMPDPGKTADPIDPNAPSTPTTANVGGVIPNNAQVSGDHEANKQLGQQLASKYGWDTGSQWDALNNIVMSESGWDNNVKNAHSDASGIAQNIKGFSNDYQQNNPGQQIQWLMDYVKQRYGTPEAAWQFHLKNGWY